MYAPSLRQALRVYAEEAAALLRAERAAGAELPFDIVGTTSQRGHTPLYCYRPMTSDFMRERAAALSRLPSAAQAVEALADTNGLDHWLRARGFAPERSDQARARQALELLREDLFEDDTEFLLSHQRFDRVVSKLESGITGDQSRFELVTEVRGLAIESPSIALGDDLTLHRASSLTDLPPRLACAAEDLEEDQRVVAVWSIKRRENMPTPTIAQLVARLEMPLRLYGDGEVSAGRIGWVRNDDSPWQPVELAPRPATAASAIPVPSLAEDELRAFVNLIGRRIPRGGEIAWALRRFEMAWERHTPAEALSDHLLALRALLEPEGSQSGYLQVRLSVLCAVPEQREALNHRVARALEVERAMIAGLSQPPGAVDEACHELAGHLRALLRDVLCGHLDADLRAVADNLIAQELAATQEPPPPPPPAPDPEPVTEHFPAVEPAPTGDWWGGVGGGPIHISG